MFIIIIIIVVAFVHLFLKLYHLNFTLYRLYCLHSNAEVFLKRVYMSYYRLWQNVICYQFYSYSFGVFLL